MLTVPRWTKNWKWEFVRQYVKKWLELGFTAAPCSEQQLWPLCLDAPKFSKMMQWNLHICSSFSFKAGAGERSDGPS